MSIQLSKVRTIARKYREANPHREGGVVLVWQGKAYGWKDQLRNADHERPGVYAVDTDGYVSVAEGGNATDGAKYWVALASPPDQD